MRRGFTYSRTTVVAHACMRRPGVLSWIHVFRILDSATGTVELGAPSVQPSQLQACENLGQLAVFLISTQCGMKRNRSCIAINFSTSIFYNLIAAQ